MMPGRSWFAAAAEHGPKNFRRGESGAENPHQCRPVTPSSSCPGIAVRRTASLPLAYVPGPPRLALTQKRRRGWGRDKPGHDEKRKPLLGAHRVRGALDEGLDFHH